MACVSQFQILLLLPRLPAASGHGGSGLGLLVTAESSLGRAGSCVLFGRRRSDWWRDNCGRKPIWALELPAVAGGD